MARNLRAKISNSDTLVIHDVNTIATGQFLDEVRDMGTTTVATGVRQVAEQSDTIITSLPEPSHVKSVFDSILASKLPTCSEPATRRLFIDCSTIDPITSRAVAASVAKTTSDAAAFLDAPMSGGVVGARAGSLTFMLGAPETLLERATLVLSMMGKRVVHLGEQGAGLCGKLANNYLLAVNNIATAEAMRMGMAWGLDAKALAGMINTSTGRCWPSEVNNPVPGVVEGAPASRDYEGGFGTSLMRKDLGLAIASAKQFGVGNVLGDGAMQVYERAAESHQCKGKDFSSVYQWLGELEERSR
ncbi:MAG: hypothetical protein M1828_004694 [Chrysothrix sp. TS-e1954]|nr:MAG: hypothetical protein M1828_004694 [Chrysothrix sp. TS-e1954]